jgi:hypothetical protein
MGVSGTNRPSHVYAEHANARDSYHGCAATPQRRWAWEAGLDVKIVSDRLGRSTTRITQDLYTHVRYEVHAAAAAQIVDCSGRNALPRGRGGDPVFSPRSTPGLPRVPR